jgi:putative ABC transport system substrate-binding protein
MRRREVIAILGGGVVGWPLAARTQQKAMPVVGYLSARSPGDSADITAAFQRGLGEVGFVDKQNVVIETRFAEGHFDRLPELATDLVRHPIDVLVATGGTVTVVKAKPVVPPAIPIVFAMGGDPVKLGVVESLSRPGANITGVTFLVNGLAAKCVELLHDLVPKAAAIGFLVNPEDPNAKPDTAEARVAANSFGQELVVGEASKESEIDGAFASFAAHRIGALFVDTEPFLADRRGKIIALAARYALPAVYQLRAFVAAGGLASYGTSIADANRQLGVYTGRLLTGTKAGDLPVIQSTRFELILNLKTAKALGSRYSADSSRPRRRGDRVRNGAATAVKRAAGDCPAAPDHAHLAPDP